MSGAGRRTGRRTRQRGARNPTGRPGGPRFPGCSGRNRPALIPVERRRVPRHPPGAPLAARHSHDDPHRLRIFEASPLQCGRLSMLPSRPHRDLLLVRRRAPSMSNSNCRRRHCRGGLGVNSHRVPLDAAMVRLIQIPGIFNRGGFEWLCRRSERLYIVYCILYIFSGKSLRSVFL